MLRTQILYVTAALGFVYLTWLGALLLAQLRAPLDGRKLKVLRTQLASDATQGTQLMEEQALGRANDRFRSAAAQMERGAVEDLSSQLARAAATHDAEVERQRLLRAAEALEADFAELSSPRLTRPQATALRLEFLRRSAELQR
jgi:hypothetical protein